jgi:hypothetical protein
MVVREQRMFTVTSPKHKRVNQWTLGLSGMSCS